MILKRLKLHNIRSYLNETVEFPSGAVLISGDIGSGKSTLLLAIEFALFGIQRGQLSGETLLRNGKTQGSVELAFTIGKDDITILRKLKRGREGVGQAAGYVIYKDRKYEGTPVELKARILDLLGYPPSLVSKSKSLVFRYTVYTPQEEMKQILAEDTETRLDTLRRVFNVDKYKRMKENAMILIRAIKQEIAVLRGKTEDLDEKERQLREREQEIKENTITLETIQPELEVIRKKLEGLKEKRATVDKERERRDQVIARIEDLEKRSRTKAEAHTEFSKNASEASKQFSTLSAQVAHLRKDAPKNPESIEAQHKKLIDEKHQLGEKRSRCKEKLKGNLDNLKRISAEIENINSETKDGLTLQPKLEQLLEQIKKIPEDKLDILEQEERNLNTQRGKVEQVLEQSSQLVDSISSLKECPTCLQMVDETHKHTINDKEKRSQEESRRRLDSLKLKLDEIQKHKVEIRTLQESRARMQEEVNDISRKLKDFEKAANLLMEKKTEQNRLLEDQKQLQEEIGSIPSTEILDEQIEGLSSEMKNISELRLQETRLDGLRVNLTTLEQQRDSITREITDIKFNKAESEKELIAFREIEKQLQEAADLENETSQKERELSLEVAETNQRITSLATQKETLEKEVQEKKKSKDTMRVLSERQRWLDEMFLNLVAVIEKHVMASVHQEFNEFFTNWFAMLMQDESMQVRLDDRFTPIVIQNGYESDIQNLSGGERTSLALAYRLALNRVINDLIGTIKTKDLIILDEPTDGFSTYQLDNVRDVLDELPNKQIIIVSHEPKVESFVQHIIRVQKQEHVSSVS